VLVAYTRTELAEALEARSAEDALAATLRVLRSMFGDRVAYVVNYVRTQWRSDPLFRGA
jgi:hypothetical protein